MSNRKHKKLRQVVRREVGDNSQNFLKAILFLPWYKRIEWALVIIFRLGYKDLFTEGKNDERPSNQDRRSAALVSS